MVSDTKYEQGEVRGTAMNWLNFLQSVIDGYEQQTSITHGVQKDGIQNGWDARKNSDGEGFEFEFKLVKGKKHTYLSMRDRGTTGLTGRVLKESELLETLPEEEKWGRFESLAFSKQADSEKTPLGSRGRGKFIFVGASKTKTIYYDSCRQDNTYRFGWRKVVLTESPITAYDEEKGRQKLKELTADAFEPLDEVGSRVIIEDPIDEVIEAIKTRELDFMIGETWWEIIRDFGIRIIVNEYGQERVVTLPVEFSLPTRDISDKKVWIRKSVDETFGGRDTTIEKLHLVCEPGKEVDPRIRGVAIQRGGMKITTIKPEVLPGDLAYAIYGYVTLDDRGDAELRRAEGLEHNTLSYRYPFTRELRVWLRDQMKEFAVEKLGYEIDPVGEKIELQQTSERLALSAINRISNKLMIGQDDIERHHKKVRLEDKPKKQVRVEMPLPTYPDWPSRIVDYEDELTDITATLVNTTDEKIDAKFTLTIENEDEEIIDILINDEVVLWKNSSLRRRKALGIRIDDERFAKPDVYYLCARLYTEDSYKKSKRIDSVRHSFYVNYSPTVKGVFEGYEPIADLPTEYQDIMGMENRGPHGGIIISYNIDHPAYRDLDDDTDAISEYLFRLGMLTLAKLDLSSEEPQFFESANEEDVDPLEVVDQYSDVLGKMLAIYHKSKR
ncbi:MAG: hypothetical protein GF411_01100 [Candidatus Lokiarchaeota archaeon]|nr:hypothetical protein [Candidatus Lokiarchaeota archaeon]